MTINQQTGRMIYNGNGNNFQFTYHYTFYNSNELHLVHYDTLTGVETELNRSQYHINYEMQPPYNFCIITYPLAGSAMSFDEQLIVYRVSPLSQQMDLSNQQAYFLESIETQLDRLTIISQNLQDQLNRAPLLPVSTPTWKQTLLGPPTPGAVLRWSNDPDDNTVESVDMADLIVSQEEIRQAVEALFDDPLFDAAWTREFNERLGTTVANFDADRVDGHNVLPGPMPSSGLVKVGDFGLTLVAMDVTGMSMNMLMQSGTYHAPDFADAPYSDDWVVDVTRISTDLVTQRAYNYYAPEDYYTRSYDNGYWSQWQRIWAGSLGDGSDLDADKVDGYDVESSPVPDSGLLKVGDFGVGGDALDFSGFNANMLTVTGFFRGSLMFNAPDSNGWFITAVRGGDAYTVQTAYSYTDPKDVRMRVYNNGTWSSWASVSFDGHTHSATDITGAIDAETLNGLDSTQFLRSNSGVSGTFTTNDGKTVTVVDSAITSIV
jgi:hypothetical protein